MLRIRFTRNAGAVTHVCRGCEARRALFRARGMVTWDRYGAVCFPCYRRHVDRERAAAAIAENPAVPPRRHVQTTAVA